MSKPKTTTEKHAPMRTCIATGEKLPKKELFRLVLDQQGKVCIDLKGKQKGRGANIKPDLAALDLALKKRAIQRALKMENPLSDEDIAELKVDFAAAIAERNFRLGQKHVTIRVKKQDLPA